MTENEWAIDTISETAEKDPLRLLDVENDTQMLLSKFNAPTETDRAISNFNKLVYNEPRPASHHITEAAGRLIPNVIVVGGPQIVKLSKNAIKKAGKDLLKKLGTAKLKKEAINKAQKNIDKTLVKEVSKKLNPEQLSHYKNAKLVDKLMKEGNIADASIVKTYDTSIDKVIADRLNNMPGDLTTRYNAILAEVPHISKSANIPETKVYMALKKEADTLYKKPLLKELNFVSKQTNDIAANPDLYKHLTDDEAAALYKARKAKHTKINSSSAYFNTGISGAKVGTDDVPEFIKNAPDAMKSSTAKWLQLHSPRLAQLARDIATSKKPVEKEIKQLTFDKEPEISPAMDMLNDIIGIDYYNPNRWRQEDVEWFLNKAQEEGLISDDRWTQWSPRQKVLKMAEIAKSPMAASFMNMLN